MSEIASGGVFGRATTQISITTTVAAYAALDGVWRNEDEANAHVAKLRVCDYRTWKGVHVSGDDVFVVGGGSIRVPRKVGTVVSLASTCDETETSG